MRDERRYLEFAEAGEGCSVSYFAIFPPYSPCAVWLLGAFCSTRRRLVVVSCQLSTFLRLCGSRFERLCGRKGTENREEGELAGPGNLFLFPRLVSSLIPERQPSFPS
jgi:hypothetical protein